MRLIYFFIPIIASVLLSCKEQIKQNESENLMRKNDIHFQKKEGEKNTIILKEKNKNTKTVYKNGKILGVIFTDFYFKNNPNEKVLPSITEYTTPSVYQIQEIEEIICNRSEIDFTNYYRQYHQYKIDFSKEGKKSKNKIVVYLIPKSRASELYPNWEDKFIDDVGHALLVGIVEYDRNTEELKIFEGAKIVI